MASAPSAQLAEPQSGFGSCPSIVLPCSFGLWSSKDQRVHGRGSTAITLEIRRYSTARLASCEVETLEAVSADPPPPRAEEGDQRPARLTDKRIPSKGLGRRGE